MNSISSISHLDSPLLTPSVPKNIPLVPVSSSQSDNESHCTSSINSRFHQIYSLSDHLKCFSSSEILLAIYLADRDDIEKQRTVDSSGLSYLAGMVLAEKAAQRIGAIPASTYRPIPPDTIAPVGMRLDTRV
ncbi:MAG: hypothetical protein JKY95_08150 [Planctomycetaceae bacterium]|nr:hypothetical protein [Planctomycetaceae bacterium]